MTNDLVDAFFNALISNDRSTALRVGRLALHKLGVQALYDDVICRSMERIGEFWQMNRITVAEEHMSTALAQFVVAVLYGELEWPPVGPKAIVTCCEHEQHQFGARMVADMLSLDGWDVRYLGGDLPRDAVVSLAQNFEPVFVAISTTLDQHVPQTLQLIEQLRAVRPPLRTMLGGAAINRLGADARSLGADAFAESSRAAVSAARVWKP